MKRDNMLNFRLEQVWQIAKLSLAFFSTLCSKKKILWLVSERGVDARDNGYWFFKYVKENHPEIDVKYIIKRNSADRKRLLQYEKDLVDFRSLQYYLLLWRASHLISSHIQGYAPFVGLGIWMKKNIKRYGKKKHVALKHGIIKDLVDFLFYDNTQVDLMTAGAKPEYEYLLSSYHYPSSVVKYTGLCRFDQLISCYSRKQILVMPTWREWIYEKDKFPQTEFAQTYLSFLKDNDLTRLLCDYDIQLVFFLHHAMQPYINTFLEHQYDSHIIIAKEEDYDVQQLLKESALLITDYSSVYFDFAYMLKPIVFYHFDLVEYRKNHYAEGWFDYNHSFGPVVTTQNDLFSAIEKYVQQNFTMEDTYRSYVSECFPIRDNKNTERVFDSIMKLS